MPRLRRPPIPVATQAQVYFRDQWLCHLCHRPIIFHLALKHLATFVASRLPNIPLAYWDPQWRRDTAPLLDELAASIDHVKAFSRGGRHDASNFAAVCARCNARKSARSTDDYLSISKPWKVVGKHGEPENWDGLTGLFIALCADNTKELSAVERSWVVALQPHLAQRATHSSKGRAV